MTELTAREYNFLSLRFRRGNIYGSHSISTLSIRMVQEDWFPSVDVVIESLIAKKVFDLSPDGYKVKFTDYGIELFTSMQKAQKDWDRQPIIKISHLNRDQILIRAGESFIANRVLREIISIAQNELCLLDAYVGSIFFDLLEDTNIKVNTRIVTSDKCMPAAFKTYMAYKSQYSHVEMRTIKYSKVKFDDRFILIDGSIGYHSGHSFKDLGTKDSQINKIKDARKQLTLFEDHWKKASIIK
jgi:hypothetical protein